jgi:hypothetical protein
VGLLEDQGRAPQARDHRLRHDDRHRAPPGRPGASARRIGPTWGELLRAQALAFLPTGSSTSDPEDGARRESGPAPAAPDVAEPLPPDQAPRPHGSCQSEFLR